METIGHPTLTPEMLDELFAALDHSPNGRSKIFDRIEERLDDEAIQFSDGLYMVATNTFTAGATASAAATWSVPGMSSEVAVSSEQLSSAHQGAEIIAAHLSDWLNLHQATHTFSQSDSII